MALGEGVPTASAVLLAPVLLPYISPTSFENSVAFSSFNPSFSPRLCSQRPHAITDSSSTHEFCPPSLPASLESPRAALHTGSWLCFLAHPYLQQIYVISDLILGALFSLWAPKRPKPKSSQVYAYFKRRKQEKKIFYRLTDNCQSFVTGNSRHSLKKNSGLLTSVLGLQNNLVLIRSVLNDLSLPQWKQEAGPCIILTLSSFHSHWLLQELTPIPRGRPRCTQGAPCTGNLEAENTWEPWSSLQSAGLVLREAGTRRDRKHINRQTQWQLQSWGWGCAMWNQLENQKPVSFLHSPFHRLFTIFSSLLSASVLVVYTITLLCLFSLGTLPFTLSFSFPFLFSTFSFCFFGFPVDSQLVFLLFLLTFLPDSKGLSQILLKSIHYIQRV